MTELKNIFKTPFLSTFFINFDSLPLSESFLQDIDKSLTVYERGEIDWHLEKSLKERNDLLFSFAISKAENSELTLAEATELYGLLEKEKDVSEPTFLVKKIQTKKGLTKKDHDHLEYYNIIKTFRVLEADGLSLEKLTKETIKKIHQQLTNNLDIFAGHLPSFEVYNSGEFRGNDKTQVGDYKPAPFVEIEDSVIELVNWLKANPSAINVFIFHTALYALHPFRNGNKRVCRVLEHFLLQSIGYNQKNLYSPSYYYHKQKSRYYKNLIEALYKHNLNYFVSFASEALFFSIAGVVNSVLQRKKTTFLNNSGLDKNIVKILKPLVKRRELKFTKFYALNKRKAARQTFVNYLEEAVASGIVLKRSQGKNTYYSLAGDYPEDVILLNWLKAARGKLNFFPEEFINYL